MIVGIIGAGNIGETLAQLWADAGHEIVFGTPDPQKVAELARSVGHGASSRTSLEAAQVADAVLVAVPFKAWPDVAMAVGKTLIGRVVLDATNINEERDGEIAERARAHPGGTLGFVSGLVPNVKLVKAFNTMQAAVLKSDAHRGGRLYGVPIAGDDDHALAIARQLVSDAGFDPVLVGAGSRAREFDEGTPVWNHPMTAHELAQRLGII